MAILVFFITIVILVLIHELGHFLAAKKFGIKVLEFGFGLPPRLWGKQWGETLVSLNWLPFGGFVRLLGEDDDDPDALKNKRSFAAQKVWQRIVVVLAGVAMNMALAWILFYGILAANNFQAEIPLLIEHNFVGATQKNEEIVLIRSVSDGSPAKAVGIKMGDRVNMINGQPVADSEDFINRVKENSGKEITLQLTDVRKQDAHEVTVTPRQNPPEGQGALGVGLAFFKTATLSYQEPWQKALSGPLHSYNVAVYSFKYFGQTIGAAFATRNFEPVGENVAGPIGITMYLGQVLDVKNPLIPYLEFLALLSLNLAIINVLPFPGLDGGRLLFLVIEAITRKKTHPTLEKYVHTVGLMILIGLIILVTASDLHKIF